MTEKYAAYISLEGFNENTVTLALQNIFNIVPDVFVVVSSGNDESDMAEIHRTETIRLIDSLINTNFTREFIIECPAVPNPKVLRFQVYRRNSDKADISHHILLASYETAPDFFSGISNRIQFHLSPTSDGPKQPLLILDFERVVYVAKDIAKLSFKGDSLPRVSAWGLGNNSAPFLVIYRKALRGDNKEAEEEKYEWTRIWTTEVSDGSRKAKWMDICIPLQKLNNGDNMRQLKIECWYWKESREHRFIGSIETTLNQLLELPSKLLFREKGGLKVTSAYICRAEEFRSNLKSCELELIVAIDHCVQDINGYDLISESKDAISATVNILKDYDTDQIIQCYGFAGKSHKETAVFPLDDAALAIEGVQNINDAYDQSLTSFKDTVLDRETPRLAPCLSHVIENVIKVDAKAMIRKKYYVLLIITDGQICREDFRSTIDIIVEATNLPLSIIIVGIGNGDFSKMMTLDGDGAVLLSSKGVTSNRDIVQFVRYHNLMGNTLIDELLWELPGQFLSFINAPNP